MSASLQSNPDRLEIVSGLMGTMLPNTIVAAYAATDEYIGKNKEVVHAFAQAYQKGADWAQANKNNPQMIELIAKFTKLPPERLRSLIAWPEFIKRVDPANLDRIAQAMKRYDSIKSVPDTKALVYETALT
jgi:NitT/TauT family transport system substrate-binding protein